MSSGTPAGRIAYLTFSKTASELASARARAAGTDLYWSKTIHAACFAAAGMNKHMVFGEEDDKILAAAGYPITGEREYGSLGGDHVSEHGYDACLYALSLSRNTLEPLSSVVRRLGQEYQRVDPDTMCRFVRKYREIKKARNKHDFEDMLEIIIKDPMALDIDALFVDEAQDLTRLQWQVVHILGAKAKRVYLAGDDDQSIYTFLGADEYGFLEHPCDESDVLKHSYRCPVGVGEYADRVIQRLTKRQQKTVEWQQRPGRVHKTGQITIADVLDARDQGLSAMWLMRHRSGVHDISEWLSDNGIEHKSRGLALNCSRLAYGVATYIRLQRGETVLKPDACMMLAALGDQANAKALRKDGEIRRVNRDTLAYCTRFEQPWNTKFLTKSNGRQLQYLHRMLKREGTLEVIGRQPTIDISTMHGSKGEEADVVFISPDCNSRVFKSARTMQPSEIRLAYVALTRARQRVMISVPQKATYLTTLFP